MTEIKENQQSEKIWILHNYMYEDFRLASCMPLSWSSFPTGFHFCEGHNIPFFRYVSFLFYVFFPYIFLVSITPRLLPRSLPRSSPGHCPGHGVALASRIFDFFFLSQLKCKRLFVFLSQSARISMWHHTITCHPNSRNNASHQTQSRSPTAKILFQKIDGFEKKEKERIKNFLYTIPPYLELLG